MSNDFDLLLDDPWSLAWTIDKKNDLKQHYREIDAPLIRYILGIGRSLAGLSPLQSDWDWSKSWNDNFQAGAFPDERLLYTGRLSIALLIPSSLFLIYLIGVKISDPICGLFSVLLLGMNALILLHCRRAMSEGLLVFGFLFALWSFIGGNRRPWLAGIGMALAFNSKHSAIALLPIGFLSVYWPTKLTTNRILRILWTGVQYLLVFILITLALNPFLWRYPIQALQASWTSRQELLANQLTDTLQLAHEQALLTPVKRIEAMTFNLYLALPAFSEINNYRDQTKISEEIYLSIPGHNLMRNMVGGGILLTFTLFGFVSAVLRLRNSPTDKRRTIVIILLSTFTQAIALILFVPLLWQRYIIPLVPLICIWVAFSISLFVELTWNAAHRKNKVLT